MTVMPAAMPASTPEGLSSTTMQPEWTERYRRFWEESYDRLDEYLDELQGRKEKDDGGKR